jgi:hypothetical protein
MLKLYVVGESSPDPDTWSGRHYLVIASDEKEAEGLAMSRPATEIPLDSPSAIPQIIEVGESGYADD